MKRETTKRIAPTGPQLPTLAEAKKILAKVGISLRYDRDLEEYNCNLSGGKEATRYYTNDLQDAIGTGMAMAEQRAAKCQLEQLREAQSNAETREEYNQLEKRIQLLEEGN